MATAHSANDGKRKLGILHRHLPIRQWLPQYQFESLLLSIVDGLALWAALVPTSNASAGYPDG
jgi:hypothetical protein